ncbi:PorP/SprF family type IX secretion system membrane protein [Pontibacter actiniarum]|uniref:Type IX secretion system membrane protein PorP/SprF n=1 Tax=Pontibacter actiniarum TaxID=323450 RepID=A0A1X9YMR5_9BACT|nr:type IX secretion system membrane protein PorP/SprF [Pontibacter actiniarum]ARS34162.1 hypothetical protein CA264_01170 [Pontibacter actiniarum]
MKLLHLLLVLVIATAPVCAQQLPQHTQYVQNNFLLNPAVAGIESYVDLRSGYRSQWVGLEGAPSSFYASVHTPLNKHDRNAPQRHMRGNNAAAGANKNNRFHLKPHHGLGAVAQMDKAGLLRTFSLNLSYAYHLPLTSSLNLSGGVTAGLTQYRLKKEDLNLVTPNDPFLAGEFGSMNKADLGLGLWLYSSNFYVGISGLQLLRSETSKSEGDPRATLQKHYYATGGIRIRASALVTLTPSVMVKVAENGLSMVDLNTKLTYARRFWVGGSYRHHDALTGTVGIYVNHLLDVSYSQDITTSDLNKVSANSHEVVLGIKLNNPQKVVCPQWIW